MSNASSNRTDILMVQETVIGTTPVSPALDTIRYTGEGLNHDIANVTSNEIRSDRMNGGLIQTGADAKGNLNFEMSAVSFDKLIAAAMASDWATDVLKNGTTLTSFTTQKRFNDTTAVTYQNFTGTCVNTMNLSLEIKSIATGSFDLMALDADMTETQFATPTIAAATTTDVMNTVSSITSIEENGVESTNNFKTLSLSLNNNIRAQDALMNFAHIGLVLGKIDLTGNISIYFKDKTMYDKYRAATAFSVQFTLADVAGNTYEFLLPSVKFETGKIVSGGSDTDIMFDGTWRAQYDATEASMMTITRTLV